MNKRNLLIGAAVSVLAVAAVFFFVNRQRTPGRSDQVIKIGAILPLTGPASPVGDQIRKAMDLANTPNGKCEIVYEDSGNLAAKGVSAFQKLNAVDSVDVVVVAMSGVSASIAPLANSEEALTFAISTSVPVAGDNNKYLVRYFIDGEAEAEKMAGYLASQGYKRIAVVQINDEYGRVMLTSFSASLKASSLSPIHIEPLEKSTTDFRPSAERLKGLDPDCIYFIGYSKPLALALKQSRETGIKAQFATTFGFEIPGTRDLAGPAADGIVYTSIPFGQGVNISPASREFVQRFEEQYGAPPSNDAAFAYDLVNLMPQLTKPQMRHDPSQLIGLEISSQFGKVSFNNRLEAKVPIVLKAIQGGVVTQVAE